MNRRKFFGAMAVPLALTTPARATPEPVIVPHDPPYNLVERILNTVLLEWHEERMWNKYFDMSRATRFWEAVPKQERPYRKELMRHMLARDALREERIALVDQWQAEFNAPRTNVIDKLPEPLRSLLKEGA